MLEIRYVLRPLVHRLKIQQLISNPLGVKHFEPLGSEQVFCPYSKLSCDTLSASVRL